PARPTRSTTVAQPRVTRYVEQKSATQAESRPAPEPTINVTIGRIEVRATTTAPATPPAASRRQSADATPMSLDDYLRQRAGGGGGGR
ncbi:MAG: hypothetical protein WCF57_01915, partial [Pyrinomonadaceae bacterium]